MAKRVGIFGWGVVAPKSPDIETFRNNLQHSNTWLEPFEGFGPNNFLAGNPEFCFDRYAEWINARFPPRHFRNLKEKMDSLALYALGAFIQALGQNRGLEAELKELAAKAQVYVGTGLGSLETTYRASVALYEAQKQWNRFWAQPERNAELRRYLASGSERLSSEEIPAPPEKAAAAERDSAEQAWCAYWMERSDALRTYLAQLAAIEALAIEGDIESGKLNVIREKEKRRMQVQAAWGAPEPPWKVSANLIWNIHNIPAAQISILGHITGPAFAPVAACSTFGVALKLGMRAIQCGDATAVVVGATDPPPHPLSVGAFYSARVLAGSGGVSLPLSGLQGTHVAGGAVVWIIGDLEYFESRGFQPLGMEPVAVGLSSDAHHIITPTTEGPLQSIRQALAEAGMSADEIGTWDLHATATPGDYAEMATLRCVVPDTVLVTARKGTFGHGMSAGSGWELTAQYLGYEQGRLYATPLSREQLNPLLHELHERFVFDSSCEFPQGPGGKLSMGIGGINACVISRPLR